MHYYFLQYMMSEMRLKEVKRFAQGHISSPQAGEHRFESSLASSRTQFYPFEIRLKWILSLTLEGKKKVRKPVGIISNIPAQIS